MPKVEIYTTATCPYCMRAKMLLEEKNVAFTEISVDGDPALRGKMTQRAQGRTTVPQIFIDGRHVGGCDDLYALDAQGALDPLLAG
ncbi:glutaredoxin 3 [Rhodoblastus acidophilus]|uniref:glutaredoxin 3 n=1 Tax=Rhodoblastus acidophilus TaxID=1074 RepID=UPI0016123EC8|nr:glutaredoxin 3 [Rhodoblastus acidophilus]MCW2283732.1 glutaredoxin 3 [Rhodoblastus acidophilus]MCW2332919.1 glutaredoxin 3 [Rhodoblastus acidophilus]